MEIEFTSAPSAEETEALTQGINEAFPEYGQARPFGFFVRDRRQHIVVGCNGFVLFGSIHTDQLWVCPHLRRQGWGRQLMYRVHEFGQKNGCGFATISTMSFQGARQFYEKLGYHVEFERIGYEKKSAYIFLRRELGDG